jgi:hypothetical protein
VGWNIKELPVSGHPGIPGVTWARGRARQLAELLEGRLFGPALQCSPASKCFLGVVAWPGC